MSRVVNGDDGWVRQPSLQRDGVELFGNFISLPNHNDTVFTLYLAGYYRWCDENTVPRLAESLHQRGIVKLTHDARLKLADIKPTHERSSHGGFFAGNQQRGPVEDMGPFLAELSRQSRLGEKCKPALAEFMAIA